MKVYFQSENGLIGTGAVPEEGMHHRLLTDAGGRPVTALPGACTFDSAMSFGLIRGGHLDMTVLGGLQVDQSGHLANWMIPGKMVPGMGGAMDLASGAKRVVIAMQHSAKGKSKIVRLHAAAHVGAADRPAGDRTGRDRVSGRAGDADGNRAGGVGATGARRDRGGARGARARFDDGALVQARLRRRFTRRKRR